MGVNEINEKLIKDLSFINSSVPQLHGTKLWHIVPPLSVVLLKFPLFKTSYNQQKQF